MNKESKKSANHGYYFHNFPHLQSVKTNHHVKRALGLSAERVHLPRTLKDLFKVNDKKVESNG